MIEGKAMLDGTASDEMYLGDGLYAWFDGWQLMLRAPREREDHIVALEPEVFANLIEFAGYINRKYDVQHFKVR
jgi:hypothetical protein